MRRKHWPRKSGLGLGAGVGGNGYLYYIKDRFTADGAILDDSLAEPDGLGVRNIIDTQGYLSKSSGIVTSSSSHARKDPSLLYGSQSRKLGMALVEKYKATNSPKYGYFCGFSSTATPTAVSHFYNKSLGMDNNDGFIYIYPIEGTGTGQKVGALTNNVEQEIIVSICNPGSCYLIKGGAFTSEYYTLLYYDHTTVDATLYPTAIWANFSDGASCTLRDVDVIQMIGYFLQAQGPYISWQSVVAANNTPVAPIDGFITYTWVPQAAEVLELSWRYQDDDNRVVLRCYQADSNLKAFNVIGGVETQAGSTGSQTWTAGNTYVIKIAYDTNHIAVYVNNITKLYNSAIGSYNNGHRYAKVNIAGTNYGIYPRNVDIVGVAHDKTNPNRAWATNAIDHLTIPTPDATGQGVHPDVLYVEDGWNGYQYWMAFTPYAETNPDVENPCIVASADGQTWVVPTGLTNPIDAKPAGNRYNSDTDLIIDPNTNIMWCIYREFQVDTSVDIIRAKYSSDGINWSDELTLFTDTIAECASPALIYDNGIFRMYSVNTVSDKIELRESSSINGTWSDPIELTTSVANPWHLDVIKYSGVYYICLLVNAPSYALHFGTSSDGITFTYKTGGLLASPGAGLWNTGLYRASIVKTATGFDMWYSANDGADPANWYIGYTQIGY